MMEELKNTTCARSRFSRIAPLVLGTLVVGLALGYGIATFYDSPVPSSPTASGSAASQATAEFWTCSMHPQVRQPGPGLCPICAMDLIPVSAASPHLSHERVFATTPEAVALMRVETAPVERRFVEAQVRMVGKISYDESRLAYITAWVPGRIERMYADFTGAVVRKNDHMVDFFSPELIAAKDELRRSRQSLDRISDASPAVLRDSAESTLQAVRNKLRRWGMTNAQINDAEKSGAPSDRITIYAPIGGTVIERTGQEGMYVETGERIYTIADLGSLWVTLEAYESDLAWLHFGQRVEFTTEAYGGEEFSGTVAFIEPTLDARTRTVDVRVNVANDDGRLKPGMFVRATVRSKVATGGRVMDPGLAGKWISPMHPEIVKDEPGDCDICGMALVSAEKLGYVAADAGEEAMPLVIPASAPLITGKRAVVYVAVPDSKTPQFEGRVIKLGPRAGDYYLVHEGLREGEQVVVQGNFKIDSALEIAAKPSMMSMGEGSNASQLTAAKLEPRLEAYVAMSKALSNDDFDHAIIFAQAFPTPKVENVALASALSSAVASESIGEFRVAFEAISSALIEELNREGNETMATLFVAHCPMAFDSQGASWIQSDTTIANPYFGASMLTCGTIEHELVPSITPSHSGSHAHHD